MPAAGPVAHAHCQGARPAANSRNGKGKHMERRYRFEGPPATTVRAGLARAGVRTGVHFGAPSRAGALAGAAAPDITFPVPSGHRATALYLERLT